jgi:hypothetical protein
MKWDNRLPVAAQPQGKGAGLPVWPIEREEDDS